ncbi:MAG: transcription termination/antitermination protein NusA [Candidatus Magasanikbacteria bacterium]|nr:transcription termination/antitermination protein NusA [Candidatus Magasanikbacteria bacterium]
MASDISKAIQFLCTEKNLPYETVLEALESALGAAFRKDFGNRQQNIKVKFDPETGDMQVWDEKEVVEDIEPEELEKAQAELTARREEAEKTGKILTEEETADLVRFNPKTQMMITEAKTHKNDIKIGDIITISLEVPSDFGRMAAQTAKQVIIQKLREAERNTVFEDFKTQEGAIVQGTIQRRDRSGGVIVDLGKITGIVPQTEQIFREQYRPGARLRFLVLTVAMGARGPEIVLSRSNNKMVETVFKQEIPEIADGSVEIKGIARDAGNRSKVAVFTSEDGIDPIGSCIGQRGSRITTIIDELGGEKIDIIQYSTDAVEYIKHALSPAKIASVTLDEATKEASATVAPDQFSLAIGRGGQNVRLAATLTGWKIKVVEQGNEDMVVSSDDNTVPEEISDETKNEETE